MFWTCNIFSPRGTLANVSAHRTITYHIQTVFTPGQWNPAARQNLAHCGIKRNLVWKVNSEKVHSLGFTHIFQCLVKKNPLSNSARVTWTTSGHYWLLLGIETHLDTDTFYQLTKAKTKSVGFATKYIYIYQSHNSLKSNCAFIKFCYTQWLDYIFAVCI